MARSAVLATTTLRDAAPAESAARAKRAARAKPAARGKSAPPGESALAKVETLRLADGRVLCARRWAGTGSGTVVLLHGLLDSSEGWATLGEQVAGTRIAFDLPGFGNSDAPQRGSIADYAQDIAEGLRLLGVQDFVLIGHSLGGAIATALAELMPERVGALVLLAPAGFGRVHLAEAISIPGIRNVVQSALPIALSSRLAVTAGYMTMVANGTTPERDVVDRVTSRGAALVNGAREGTRAIVDAGRSHGAFHRRRVGYDGPVFAIWGDQDRLVPTGHRHGVRAAFPHARIDVWRGMGHHALRERHDELVSLIAKVAQAANPQTARPSLRQARAA